MITNTNDHPIFIYSERQLEVQKKRRSEQGMPPPKERVVCGKVFTGVLAPGAIARWDDAIVVYEGIKPEITVQGRQISEEKIQRRISRKETVGFRRGFFGGIRRNFFRK